VVIAIIPTIIYYISIHFLGEPVGNIDDGVVIASYLGLMLVGAVFVAIGVFVSSLTENQIVALLLAVFFSWFVYLGFDILATYSQFGNSDYIIKNLGVFEHFLSIQKGVLVLSDLLYFLSCITIFMLATKLVLQSRKW